MCNKKIFQGSGFKVNLCQKPSNSIINTLYSVKRGYTDIYLGSDLSLVYPFELWNKVFRNFGA